MDSYNELIIHFLWRIYYEKNHLKNITEDEIKKAFKYQKKIGWTLYHERNYLGTMVQNRFNFLLVAFSLFTTTYFMVPDNINKLAILIIGGIIISLLSIAIFRAYVRQGIILQIISCHSDKSAFSIVNKELQGKMTTTLYPFNAMIGVIIPFVMILLFVIGIVYNLLKTFQIL